MISQSSTAFGLLEQAKFALEQGHLGQARCFLERLVIVDPDNSEAQALRANVIAQQAVLAEAERRQRGRTLGDVMRAQNSSTWMLQPIPSSRLALSRKSHREIMALIYGAICLWGGCNLVHSAVLAGAHGQVMRQSESGHQYEMRRAHKRLLPKVSS